MTKVNMITTDEYFDLLKKDNNDLMPNEILAKYNYERFISHAKKYEELLSMDAVDVLNNFNSKIIGLSQKENKTVEETRILEKYRVGLENQISEIEEINNNNDEDYSRKLKKAGYIDASVILIILLNIGFIVALAIIGS